MHQNTFNFKTITSLTCLSIALLIIFTSGCSKEQDDTSPVSSERTDSIEEQQPQSESLTQPTPQENPNVTQQDASSQPISFSSEVLPILENHCALCHAPGSPGSTHMELAVAADALVNAFGIGRLVDSGDMPPWPASKLSLDFVGDHSITEEQKKLLVAWADQGGPIDTPPDKKIVSQKPLMTITEPDLAITSAKGPYQGSTDNLDDYRCMIFDPDVKKTEWILASHFVPDKLEIVHHGIFTLASEEYREQAEQLDESDTGVGWSCYGGTGLIEQESGYQFGFGGWAPGDPPEVSPDGYAVPLRPGDFLIVQLHYHYDYSAPPDLSTMLFDLASDEDIAANGGAFKTLTGQLFLGPAEIPCYDGDTHPLCDRDAAIENATERFGLRGQLSNFFNRQCGFTPADYAHMTTGTANSSCDIGVSAPGKIVSLTGHMHELGLSIRLTLNPETENERILLDIPDWDFQWQLNYHPVEEIILQYGDTIRVDCAWNRERAPYEAVGYILWSLGTGDEMCYSGIRTAPMRN